MGHFWRFLVVPFCLLLVGRASSQPVGAPTSAPGSVTPVVIPAGPPSYIAINCGGLTPANASIPNYYGVPSSFGGPDIGVQYGYGTFYQPNNSYVSTGSMNGAVVFQSDRYYYGTSTKPREYLNISPLRTADGALYLTERYGLNFAYEFNVPNGNYNVDLYFAELQYNSVGARVFSVAIQGQTVIPSLDIYAQVGANASLIITKPAVVSNGLLSIFFDTVSSDLNSGEAKVNALRVYTSSQENVPFPAPPSSYFVDAGSSAFYIAADGTNYTRDSYYSSGVAVQFTGRAAGAPAPAPLYVARTADPAVYSTARVGQLFTYYFNLPIGLYKVDLEFVEGQYTQAGQRQFVVDIQGVRAFPLIDIIANSSYALSPAPASASAPSPSFVYTPTSFNLSTAAVVSDGLLRVDFTGVVGNATVSAIRVSPLNSPTNATIAVDCGSPIDVITGNGVIFQADLNYSGSSVALETNPYQVFLPYNDDVDDFIYPTVREGNFTYNFSLPNGTYLVDLYFADLNATGPGQRIFDVYLQEKLVLSHLDVFAQTGGNITTYIVQAAVNVTSQYLLIRFQSSPDALSLPNITLSNYTLGGSDYTDTLLPPFLSALFVHPGIPLPGTALAPAPAPGALIPAPAPAPMGPPPPPGAPDPYFAYVYTPADAPRAPLPPVPTFGGAAAANPNCPANGAPPLGLNCTGPCPLWNPNFALNVAVNSGGPQYTSSCGIVFEDDQTNTPTACDIGDVIPDGRRWCRTNIHGPSGGYQFQTTEQIANTSDPTIFQSEFIGFNSYKFALPTPGIYQVYCYFAEISDSDPTVDVNRPGLRIFYIHFNGNPADAIGPIDPFADAGDQKFTADAPFGRNVQCDSNVLTIQLEPDGAGRDAPKFSGVWVYGPVDANFNALAPLAAQSPTSGSNSIAPPPPLITSNPPSSSPSSSNSAPPTPSPSPSSSSSDPPAPSPS